MATLRPRTWRNSAEVSLSRSRPANIARPEVRAVDGSKPISATAIGTTLHHLFAELGLQIPPGASRPRVHDLRHSFAVGTLLRWYREGLDPATRLLHLSTFLGHADPASTAVYLTITPELLAQASRRFERFAGEKLREVLT